MPGFSSIALAFAENVILFDNAQILGNGTVLVKNYFKLNQAILT